MTGYIINFGVYTMAMVGFIVIALLVYKKSTEMGTGGKNSLKIDEKITLNARKSLYVVNAGGERFLIAGDIDNTSLIARLGEKETLSGKTSASNPIERKSYVSRDDETIKVSDFKSELEAKKSLDRAFEKFSTEESVKFERRLDIKNIRKKPVMKELARKLAEV